MSKRRPLSTLTAYSLAKNGLDGRVKSPIIMGHFGKNTIAPLVYLRQPKWMSDEDFSIVIDSLTLSLEVQDD